MRPQPQGGKCDMAVVKMKRVTLVGAADLKEQVLKELMDLGVVHVEPLVTVDESPADLVSRIAAARRALTELKKRAKEHSIDARENPTLAPDEALQRVTDLIQRRAELESRRSALSKEAMQAEPWGNVQIEDMDLLKENGVNLIVGQVQPATLKKILPLLEEAAWYTTVSLADGRDLGVAAIFNTQPPGELELEDTPMPQMPFKEVRSELKQVTKDLDEVETDLNRVCRDMKAVNAAEREMADQLALLEVKLTLGGDEEIFALTGWCPIDRLAEVEKLPGDRAFAVMSSDPESGEYPPIILKNGKFSSFFEPLLKAFNLPHYREGDPTVFFAPFMAAFFGFCLGDVAYGILLFICATVLGKKFKAEGEALKAVRLMQTLGISAALIGGLTGMVFGEKYYEMLGLNPQGMLYWLSEDPSKFFYLSLGFGAVQLTFGMLIKLFRLIRLERYQEAVSMIGWLALLPGVGVWVMKGTPLLFIAGAVLIFLFNAPSPSVVKRLGGGAWALYNISGLFGDVMSYARIFGLGLSTGIIGHVINIIAMAAGGTPYIGWIFTLLILVIGHTFNFAMAVIGSVVHPARLQFLEFFGKFFEGGGDAYRPFGKAGGG